MHPEESKYVDALISRYSFTWKRELPVGNSRADLAELHIRQFKLWEIKTHADTTRRLSRQVTSYCKVTPTVHILTCAKHIKAALSQQEYIGVSLLSDGKIQEVRRPEEYWDALDYRTMFSILRQEERATILKEHTIVIDAPAAFRYELSLEAFKKLPIKVVYTHLANTLYARYRTNNN